MKKPAVRHIGTKQAQWMRPGDGPRRGSTVRLEGDLALLLGFAAGGQQNARQGLPDGRSTKLVAGARNHLNLFEAQSLNS